MGGSAVHLPQSFWVRRLEQFCLKRFQALGLKLVFLREGGVRQAHPVHGKSKTVLNSLVTFSGKLDTLTLHLRPYLLMDIGRHPLLLQCLTIESQGKPVVVRSALDRTEQMRRQKSGLRGDRRQKDLAIGLFQSLPESRLKLQFNMQNKHIHLTT